MEQTMDNSGNWNVNLSMPRRARHAFDKIKPRIEARTGLTSDDQVFAEVLYILDWMLNTIDDQMSGDTRQ